MAGNVIGSGRRTGNVAESPKLVGGAAVPLGAERCPSLRLSVDELLGELLGELPVGLGEAPATGSRSEFELGFTPSSAGGGFDAAPTGANAAGAAVPALSGPAVGRALRVLLLGNEPAEFAVGRDSGWSPNWAAVGLPAPLAGSGLLIGTTGG